LLKVKKNISTSSIVPHDKPSRENNAVTKSYPPVWEFIEAFQK